MLSTLIAFTLLINSARAVPLALDTDLSHRAQIRAEYLCAHNQWSHEGERKSFEGLNWKYGGENLARGFADASSTEAAWMKSPGHRANILKPQYTRVGIGQSCGITVALFEG